MSLQVKQFRELQNQVFDKFYTSKLMPSVLGGMPDTAIMQLLIMLRSIMNIARESASISADWISDVSWFTPRLEAMFQLPRFEDESDRIYYDRLLALIDAQQDEVTIKTAITTLISDAIAGVSAITIASQLAQGNWADAGSVDATALFYNNTPADVWGDLNTSLRSVVKIIITFLNKVTDGLIGWWRLDGNVRDDSGNGYDGTNNGVTFDYAKWNYGGNFISSENDYISLPAISKGSITSYSFWINTNIGTANQTIISDGSQSPTIGFVWIYTRYNGYIALQYTDGTNIQIETVDLLTGFENTWMHVVVTVNYTSGALKMYRNSIKILDTTMTTAAIPPDRVLYLGNYSPSHTTQFNGQMDEFRIYNTELTQAEVDLLYDYKTTYDYWSADMNITKIASLIDLYRPPGITYEIELLPP